MLPFIWLLPIVGFGWGHWDRALVLRGTDTLMWVLITWTLLQLGTMWLNASLDRDDGELLFGRAETPPDGLCSLAYVALLAALVIGVSVVGWVIGCCVAMSVAYSHPRVAWKGHPVWGPVVNIVGYGLLSPYAGWLAVGVSLNVRTLAVGACVGSIVLGCYFGAQAFQEDEDRARGYRTWVVLRGAEGAIRAARVWVSVGIGLGLVLCVCGWLPRACLVVVPFTHRLHRYFYQWEQAGAGADVSWASGLNRRLLVMALVTLLAATTQYVSQSYHGLPVAGLGTVGGHPDDRPRLSPRQMRNWETQHERL